MNQMASFSFGLGRATGVRSQVLVLGSEVYGLECELPDAQSAMSSGPVITDRLGASHSLAKASAREVGEISFGLEPGLAIAGPFFRQQQIKRAVGVAVFVQH